MKWNNLFQITIIGFLIINFSGYADAVDADQSLVAYYPFDGDTKDYSGKGYDATNHGATFVSGVSGQALSFDGAKNYVYSPVNINPDVMPQLTMMAWARPDKAGNTIISHDNGDFDRTIDIDTRGGGLGWSAFTGSGVLGFNPVTIGKWDCLATVYDQDAQTVKLYVNDEVYDTKGKPGRGWDYTHIGSNPSFGAYFAGTIDEVRIYNSALSTSEIKSICEGKAPPVSDPTSPPTTSAPTIPAGFSGLIFESRSKPAGSEVQIPLTLKGVKDKIGNMDIILSYDSTVLRAKEAKKGSLTERSVFDHNIIDGTIKISLADREGFSGDWTVAEIIFEVIGKEGTSSQLKIVSVSANRADDMTHLDIPTKDGIFTVIDLELSLGHCTGEKELSYKDVLCALQMAVEKRSEEPSMDVNRDGKVNSLDARKILRSLFGLEVMG
jgi:hypothetical protein